MKLNISKISEEKRIVLGTVKSVTPGSDGKEVNVKLEGNVWNKDEQEEKAETLDIAFFNSDSVKMADRVIAAKVNEGSVLTVEIYEKDGKIFGNNFKYSGHWIVPASGERKEKNIFHGVVSSMQEDAAGRFVRVSMPINGKEGEEPTWASITFWNNETNNVAERAKKCLYKRTNEAGDEKCAKAVIICGENKPYNGKDYYNGFDFVLID